MQREKDQWLQACMNENFQLPNFRFWVTALQNRVYLEWIHQLLSEIRSSRFLLEVFLHGYRSPDFQHAEGFIFQGQLRIPLLSYLPLRCMSPHSLTQLPIELSSIQCKEILTRPLRLRYSLTAFRHIRCLHLIHHLPNHTRALGALVHVLLFCRICEQTGQRLDLKSL